MAKRLDYIPTVLLVEDDEEVRSEMKQVLEMSGYCVVDSDSGQDAVESARDAHPDLVFVDLNLPLLYGLTAARQIIKKAQLGSVPVVVVTHEEAAEPYPMEVNVRRNEYVTRMADYEQLEHLLDYLLPIQPHAA